MESVRRGRVRACVAAAVCAVVVAACAGPVGVAPDESVGTTLPATSSTAVTTEVPYRSAYGGTVVVGVADGGSPRGLNPFLEGPDSPVLDLIAPAVFAQGFDTDPVTGERLPDALEAIPSIEEGTIVPNGDGTATVTVRVVEGAQWADGTPMTADDLAFTIDVASDRSLPIRDDIADRYAAVVPGSARSDGRTLTFRMRAGSDPGALFEFIVPRHAVEGTDFTEDWNDTLWTSGGPFVLTDWVVGSYVELGRNENYWKVTAAEGAPLPFLDRIVVRFFEPGTDLDPRLVDGFERGELDVAVFERSESRGTAFSAAVGAGAVLESVPSGEWDQLNFQFGPGNRNESSLNDRLELRRAVAFAVDRDELAESRGTVRVDSILQRYLPSTDTAPYAVYDADLDQVKSELYDIEVATGRDMFSGDGPPVIVTVASDVASTVSIAGEIVVMLGEAGIGAQLQLEGSDLFFGSTLDNGSWDVSSWRIGAGAGLGAAMDFFRIFDPDGLPFVGDNFFRWGTVDSTVTNDATDRYREIIDELDATIDPAEQTDLLIEAEQILADEMVVLPLIVSHLDGTAHWPDAVSGVESNPRQGVLWNVDVWRVPQSVG